MVLHSGNHEVIGVRHRESQTLFVSDVIEPHICVNPGYGKLHVGVCIASIEDVCDRKVRQGAFADSGGEGSGGGSGDGGPGGEGPGAGGPGAGGSGGLEQVALEQVGPMVGVNTSVAKVARVTVVVVVRKNEQRVAWEEGTTLLKMNWP
jgi:hypothetical protein